MKNRFIISVLAFALASANIIYLIGDSTCTNYPEDRRPRYGWGEKLEQYLSGYKVDNRAVSGRSTKSFISEDRWSAIMDSLKAGDYVFIQFGHNDEKLNDPKRGTEPFGEYYDNLCRFISDTRSKGATPILLTPVCRRKFDSEGKVVLTHKDYPAAMKKAGKDTDTPVIDMEAKTFEWLQKAGKSESAKFFMYSADGKDNTHFREEGADAVAKMVADEFGAISTNSPAKIGRKVAGQLLTTEPEFYRPTGYGKKSNYGNGKYVHYSTISYWMNSLEFARLSGDKELESRLIAMFEPFFGEKKALRNRMDHLDYAIFGCVPLEIYLLNGDKRCLKLGLSYADAQWKAPRKSADGFQGNPSYEQLKSFYKDGYSSHTRIWIDDMYMITVLQTQAYRATGKYKYIERSARQMAMYLDRIQNPDGLFYHAEGKHFVWGRGDGWMAAGMPLLLQYMKPDDPNYGKILEGYRKMMDALLKWQRDNGLWGQLVNDPGSWDETSASAMFAFGMLEGVRNGWLTAESYRAAAIKAWDALCGRLDENGNIAGVCIGTGAREDRDWYLNRPTVSGDPHGQAPMMWICNSLLK